MKILHTADLHLGKVLHEQSLLDDQSHALDLLVQELEAGNYDLFLIAGDIFDRAVPPAEAVVLWDDFLTRTANLPRLVTVVVSGNHDGALRLSYATKFLEHRRIHLRTRPQELDRPVTLEVNGEEWDVFAVPFLQAGSLGERADSEQEIGLRSQRELWEQAVARLAQARRPGVRSVLVTHLFTLGGKESESERMFLGEAEQVPCEWLMGWDYVALGHLHRAQEPAPGVRYSGSPLAYSFSESGQQKCALRWHDGAISEVPLVPLRPLSRLSGSFEDFVRTDFGQEFRDHWLELTLTDEALVASPLDRLRPRFPRLLSLVQAPLQTKVATPQGARRRTGDLVGDTQRFLQEVGLELKGPAEEVLRKAVEEVSREAP